MPNVSEIMTTDVQVVTPQDSLQHAAQMMQDLDVGALPVCNGDRLLGMLTDRDIAIRGVAAGMAPQQACVADVMSGDVECCDVDQDSEEVMRQMGDHQIRRMPVLDANKKLVGIVSLGDMAVRQTGHIDEVVREVSQPGHPASAAR